MNQQVKYVEIDSDERAERRKHVLKKGIMAFGEQFSGQPCIVRDMTEKGARVEIESPIAHHREFTLHVEIDGFQVLCEIVWYKFPLLGVNFIGERQKTVLARKQVVSNADASMSKQISPEEKLRELRLRQAGSKGEADIHLKNRVKGKSFGKRAFKG